MVAQGKGAKTVSKKSVFSVLDSYMEIIFWVIDISLLFLVSSTKKYFSKFLLFISLFSVIRFLFFNHNFDPETMIRFFRGNTSRS